MCSPAVEAPNFKHSGSLYSFPDQPPEHLLDGFNFTCEKPSTETQWAAEVKKKRIGLGSDYQASLLTQSVLTAARARQEAEVRVALALPLSIPTGSVLFILVVQVRTRFLLRHMPAVGVVPLADAEEYTWRHVIICEQQKHTILPVYVL